MSTPLSTVRQYDVSGRLPARPLRVLHRAGNSRGSLALARRPEVDAIEADVWVRSGRLVANHDRPLGPLPLTVGRGGIRREPRQPVDFAELLAAVDGHAELLIDLRSWFGDPAPDVARALLPLPDRSHLRVACESWATAERLHAWVPDMTVAYSIRSEADLRRFFVERMAGKLPPAAVAVRHTLLHSALEAESLSRRASWVAAWTVDDAARAQELAGWGVDAIISNEPDVLDAL